MIGQDKIEHWAFGFVLSFLGLFYQPLIWSGMIFAFGKELYDHRYGTGWDWKDLQATLIGSVCAICFIAVLKWTT